MRSFDPLKVPKPKITFDFEMPRSYRGISLEIGAGVGFHAIQFAQKNPHRALIAIEKTSERFAKLARRIQSHDGIRNLFPIHAEAASFITHFVPPESLEDVFILYPNPYHKNKHRNLRWHNRAFMAFLLDRLIDRGKLTLATNVEDYAEEALEMLGQVWGMKPIEFKQLPDDFSPRSHFERKYLTRGERCWNLVFEKS